MKLFVSTQYKEACEWLNDGKLLAYPTEAVWGIGCNPFNQQAVLDLLQLKNRPMEKGLIVLAPNVGRMQDFCKIYPNKINKLS